MLVNTQLSTQNENAMQTWALGMWPAYFGACWSVWLACISWVMKKSHWVIKGKFIPHESTRTVLLSPSPSQQSVKEGTETAQWLFRVVAGIIFAGAWDTQPWLLHAIDSELHKPIMDYLAVALLGSMHIMKSVNSGWGRATPGECWLSIHAQFGTSLQQHTIYNSNELIRDWQMYLSVRMFEWYAVFIERNISWWIIKKQLWRLHLPFSNFP